MTTLRFGRQVCGSLDEGSAREWLVTDGLGGYAMGTVAGLATRRYHGLLVVATRPPIGRQLGLAALDPVLVLGDARIRLGVHEWAGGARDPNGSVHLESFELVDGVPRWRWSVGTITLEAELAMAHGRPAVGVRYRLVRAGTTAGSAGAVGTVGAAGTVGLEVEALATWRDAHGERFAGRDPSVEATADGFVFEGAYRVRGPGFRPGGEWYRGVHHREEAARGLPPTEDLWFAGRFTATLAAGDTCGIEAWAGDLGDAPPAAAALVDVARARARSVAVTAGARDEPEVRLAHAADQFVVTTADGPTVVAGYPWFGDWSRDTMTSYEGLFLETGRVDEGRALLEAAGATVSEGMLANTADAGGTAYNTVDGSLWFLHAVGRHVERTGDTDLARAVLPAVHAIVDHHLAGTRFGIRVDGDGLVTQGADGWALTWMDARVDGTPITARRGKAVEVNALWIDGLAAAASAARAVDEDPEPFARLGAAARRSFVDRFGRPDGGLYDVVDGPDGDDASVRPNQLLAVALANGPLGPDAARPVLAAIAPLTTSFGLRSLSPFDPRYRPCHRGGPAERDAAYHQGTVWPWLVGPLVDALVAARAVGDRPADAAVLAGLEAHLDEWGLGSVSETADGDPPHGATGCPFQAWSVAEVLRARRRLA